MKLLFFGALSPPLILYYFLEKINIFFKIFIKNISFFLFFYIYPKILYIPKNNQKMLIKKNKTLESLINKAFQGFCFYSVIFRITPSYNLGLITCTAVINSSNIGINSSAFLPDIALLNSVPLAYF